ncbi:MAG: hypothetical protein KatS3mg091_868 [Patescibacteria group bacterium]|nr:MAG: hypothetical protein KatS3mg091_868 [Patescibacteria group bacterium]
MESNRRDFIKGIAGALIASSITNELEKRQAREKPLTYPIIPNGNNYPLPIFYEGRKLNITDLELLLTALSSMGFHYLLENKTQISRREFFKTMLQLGIGAGSSLTSTFAILYSTKTHPDIDPNFIKRATQRGLDSNLLALAYRLILSKNQKVFQPSELNNMPITEDYTDSEGYRIVTIGEGPHKIRVVFGNPNTKHTLILPNDVVRTKKNLTAVAVSPSMIQKSGVLRHFIPAGAVDNPFLNYYNCSYIEIPDNLPDEIKTALQYVPAPLVSWLNGLYPPTENLEKNGILSLHNEFVEKNSFFKEYHHRPPIGSGKVCYQGQLYSYHGAWGIHDGKFYGAGEYTIRKDNTLQGFGTVSNKQGTEIPFLISGGPFSIYEDTGQAYETLKMIMDLLGYNIISYTTSDTGSSSVIFSNGRRTSHTPSINLHHQISGAIGF